MLKKNDFVEIEFSGRVKGGEIFDTTFKEEAEKLGIKKDDAKPIIVCIGQGMLVSGLDKALEGKETGKDYNVELASKDAFGDRDRNLIKTIPLKVFLAKEINPYPGLVLALDNMLAKVIAVSGGRVITDFNNPLAGKDVVYKIRVLRIVDRLEDKIGSIVSFFLKGKFDFEIKGNALVFKIDNIAYESYIGMLKDKLKELFGMDISFELKQKTSEASEASGAKKPEDMAAKNN